MMPDNHPLSVAAASTLALQNADTVFLMGARFNWIFHRREFSCCMPIYGSA